MTEYFYDKYKLITTWDTNSEEATNEELIHNSTVVSEDVNGDDYSSVYGWYTGGYYANYEKYYEDVHGFKDYKLRVTNHRDYPIFSGNVFKEINGDIIEGYVTWTDEYDRVYWQPTTKHSLDNTYYIYEHKDKGDLLEEDLIKDSSYPTNGPKDDYWWVRKGEYTIPAPTVVSPDDGEIINVVEGDVLPVFVFTLNERENNDNNKYHTRLRIGTRADFISPAVVLESKEDQSIWEFYNEETESWEAFPVNGVPANTKVRVTPVESETDNISFGFYYWDCAAYNATWGYGVSSNHRVLIVITESEEVYYLVVAGKRYYATKLNVKESSHGEISQINFELINNNI